MKTHQPSWFQVSCNPRHHVPEVNESQGKPPLWTPLKEPVQLKQDGGDFFRDENAARYPSYPTEPAVQAILRSDPAFPTSSIDIFACGSTMGNLLRFVRRIEKPFRFEVEVTGNTVFFVRKENSPKELIEGIRGFGHTFPEAYTTWEDDVKGSGTHQRLIQYSFGGHKCLVRFECDGYLDRLVAGSASTEVASAEGSFDVDSLAHALHKTSVTQAFDYNLDHLMVRTGGSNVPQACTFDLKTRSKSRGHDIDMADILPSLYIKQIPNFIVAYHNGYGVFDRGIEVKNFKKETKKWETENADALERLAILLCKIVRMARSDKKGLLEVYCPSVDRLEIRKQFGEGKHALPLRLREEWAGTHEQLVGSSVLSDARDSRNSSNSPELVEKLYYSIESDSDDDGSKDFTACSADSCGYCGRCSY